MTKDNGRRTTTNNYLRASAKICVLFKLKKKIIGGFIMKTLKLNLNKFLYFFFGLFLLASPSLAALNTPAESADRAVEIARQSRDRVERNGKTLKASSHALFKEFAEKTATLQKLIDTRRELEETGFLTKGDPDGDARRAHINAKILMEVGELKEVCDKNLDSLLYALESFDTTVVASLVDSQATRSINSNYELSLDQYLKKEKARFIQANQEAESTLMTYQDETDPRKKNRLLKKYTRAKKRLLQIKQRRDIYEARIKSAALNQKITEQIRKKISNEGNEISSKFRQVIASLYTTFGKITPVAEMGGTGSPSILRNLGFSNLEEVNNTLGIVDDAVEKLGKVLDNMVSDVLTDLGGIQVVKDNSLPVESVSIEEEMEFLRKQREAWNS